MIEVFKHIFGFCGEGHPSLLCTMGILPILIAFKTHFLRIGYMVSNTIKLYLKRLYKFLHYN